MRVLRCYTLRAFCFCDGVLLRLQGRTARLDFGNFLALGDRQVVSVLGLYGFSLLASAFVIAVFSEPSPATRPCCASRR